MSKAFGAARAGEVEPMEAATAHAVGHEYTDINSGWTVFSVAVVAALVVGCCLVGRWIFDELLEPADQRSNTSLTGEGLSLPPKPRLEGIEMMSAADGANTTRFIEQQAELEQLQTYGWVNKDQRIVRIPIERAMQLMIENGLPVSNEQQTGGNSQNSKSDGSPEKKAK
jgi:hypothetical protein